MKGKTKFAIIFFGIIGVLLITSGGASDKAPDNTAKTDSNNAMNTSQGTQSAASGAGNAKSNQSAQRTQSALFTGDGGKGIIIAVPVPVLRDAGSADSYMPQFFQDIITGGLAKFSAMTVLDRANESLAIAEQKRSETGFYSDNEMVEIGKMTNARYIVAGSIQNTGGMYAVTFRINNPETNEIKASFNERYGKADMESGKAAREAVKELLAGMGVELTAEGERQLLAEQRREVQATRQLAQGMAAERSGNIVEALAFYTEAVSIVPTMKEASERIQNFNGAIQTGSVRERAEYAQQQIDRWVKIFQDLRKYVDDNLTIVVYDFSAVKDEILSEGRSVRFKIYPGVKVIPDRTTLLVYKRIKDEWEQVRKMEENKSWANSVPQRLRSNSYRSVLDSLTGFSNRACFIDIGLYDEYGDRIDTIKEEFWFSSYEPMAQHKYFNDTKFKEISSSLLPIAKISDTITPRIIEVCFGFDRRNLKKLNPPVLTVPEWEQWLSLQGTAR